MITRDTPWRDIGPVDLRTWQRVIDNAGGPEGLIREEAWTAAGERGTL